MVLAVMLEHKILWNKTYKNR